MKLKAQILTLFILTSVIIIIVTGYLYYNNVRNILVTQNINELKAVSQSKSLRVNSIIHNKIIELGILRRSPLIRSELFKYINSRNKIDKIALYNSIIRSKEAIEGINRLIILDSAANVIIASNPGKTLKENFSDYKCVSQFDDKSKVNIEYRYNEHEELVLCIAGYIDSGNVLLIENDINNILAVSEDYTGLGATGESAIFYIDEDSNIIYLTPLRFYDKPFLKEVKNPEILNFQTNIKKGMVVYNGITDYRKEKVIASVSPIARTDWKIMTKIDVTEALAYMEELREMTVVAAVIVTVVMFVLIYLFAWFFVKPINDLAETAEEISQGDFDKRVTIKNKNELGQLALSFNKMTDSLVAAQNDLRLKIRELNRSNDALDNFAHVVSHDLKAPLSSIEGLTNLLRLEFGDKLTPGQLNLLNKIQDQTRQMKNMIKGILEFSEVKVKKSEAEYVDLNEVIENIIQNLSVPVHIKTEIFNTMPIIRIERVLIMQVFQNLLSNAIKYIDKHEGFVRVAYLQENNCHKFSVSDNGSGIEKEFHNTIFEIFNTGEARKGYDSTGVGLAIVKNIIEEKGGKIWVESEKGKGATFFFTLPISKT